MSFAAAPRDGGRGRGRGGSEYSGSGPGGSDYGYGRARGNRGAGRGRGRGVVVDSMSRLVALSSRRAVIPSYLSQRCQVVVQVLSQLGT